MGDLWWWEKYSKPVRAMSKGTRSKFPMIPIFFHVRTPVGHCYLPLGYTKCIGQSLGAAILKLNPNQDIKIPTLEKLIGICHCAAGIQIHEGKYPTQRGRRLSNWSTDRLLHVEEPAQAKHIYCILTNLGPIKLVKVSWIVRLAKSKS